MNIHDARRVIVVSDAHGHVDLIENALDHAAFDPASDGLVYAGDLVDGGSDPSEVRECIGLLKDRGAQFLWGNHDVAVLLDYHIDFQEPVSRPYFTGLFRDEFRRTSADRWRLAVRVQGVFVTHAGISTDYLDDYRLSEKSRRVGCPDGFVQFLNDLFDQAASRQLSTGQRDRRTRIMRRGAPHRFRPFASGAGPDAVLPGATQVAGHSPPERFPDGIEKARRLADAGLHIVDPSYDLRADRGGFRYAVIENGHVQVLDDSTDGGTRPPSRMLS